MNRSWAVMSLLFGLLGVVALSAGRTMHADPLPLRYRISGGGFPAVETGDPQVVRAQWEKRFNDGDFGPVGEQLVVERVE